MERSERGIRLKSLLSTGARTPGELQERMGISQPTLSRLVADMAGEVVSLGRGKATRYALPRPIKGGADSFPVYRIDERGDVHLFGTLRALQGGEYWWKAAEAGGGRLMDHLPWFVQDLRPDGFMGRAFAQREGAALGLPSRLADWSDDDLLVALSRRGDDCMGDLLVGEESLARYFQRAREPIPSVLPDDRAREYPRFARLALDGAPPGSSAGGEQPKFAVMLEGERPCHALVKFSFETTTAEGRRWADLLVCEHLALQTVKEAGIRATCSRIVEGGGRVFLEVARFDRVGRLGRLPLVSLGALEDEFFGRRDNWIAASIRLEGARMICPEDAAALRWLSVFGILIGNTDQHFGNVSLIRGERERFTLAPAYDVLPMFYRPVGSEIAARRYELPLPPPGASLQWQSARPWAERFWVRAATDERISPEFRRICRENRTLLDAIGNGPRLIE